VFADGHRLAPGAGVPGYSAEDGRVTVRIADRGMGTAIELEPGP
jgi:hypothetical protein